MRYEIPYDLVSSQKTQDELVPKGWIENEVKLIREEAKKPAASQKKPRRHLLENVLNEFATTTFDNAEATSMVEGRLNSYLDNQLKGAPIPSHGFVLNTCTKMWEYAQPHPVTGQLIQIFTPITLKIGFQFPEDDTRESCLREIIGMDEQHTTFFQIPFRLLTKNISGHPKKPVRNNHWVYRIRFIIKDEAKYKKSLNQYYRGYIGATSQPNVVSRFFQHFQCYKSSDATNEIYRAWRELRDNDIEHILILEVLDRCSTHEEAFKREADLIKFEGTLMPDGFNMTPGGEEGLRQCKACGIEADFENKEDQFADYVKYARDKHITPVRSHLRRMKSGFVTTVRGHWRCLDEVGKQILRSMGVDGSDIKSD